MTGKLNGVGPDWEASIVKDIAFIRQHKRYRWTLRNAAPLLVYTLLSSLLLTMTLLPLSEDGPVHVSAIGAGRYLVLGLYLLFVLLCILQYLKSLYFLEIPTGLAAGMNLQLLTAFLQQRRLLVFHHPLCADIVQIISRPLNQNDDRRETVFFIIDENRILVNSHFTNAGWRLISNGRHDKEMADALKQFIEQYKTSAEQRVFFPR